MHSNRELVQRIRDVLRAMSILSESSAVRLDGDRVSGGGSKSAPPPGTRFGARDLRDLSLATYWDQRFKAARGDVNRLTTLVLLAERDLARAKRRPPAKDPHESVEDRESRVLLQYEGLTPLEAALVEDCSEIWIRAVRGKHERDAQTGFSRTGS
jgi:hypothetical protein